MIDKKTQNYLASLCITEEQQQGKYYPENHVYDNFIILANNNRRQNFLVQYPNFKPINPGNNYYQDSEGTVWRVIVMNGNARLYKYSKAIIDTTIDTYWVNTIVIPNMKLCTNVTFFS